MFLKNDLLPDIEVADLAGVKHRLWDYRQKTHLMLLFGEGAAAADATLAAKRKIFDWLGVKIIPCGAPPSGFDAGAVCIDRYGRFLDAIPFGDDLADRAEKEFLYYEAKHC